MDWPSAVALIVLSVCSALIVFLIFRYGGDD